MLQKFDPRNRDLIVCVNGELLHRDRAGVSPFDSAVQGGDAVWEGLRLYDGRIFRLQDHLDRLRASAQMLSFERFPDDRNRVHGQYYLAHSHQVLTQFEMAAEEFATLAEPGKSCWLRVR